jgi:outer membrane immunogenic protein
MRKIVIAGVVTASLGYVPAFAADLGPVAEVSPAAPTSPVHDWTGFYIGGILGYAWGDYTLFSASGRGPSVDVDGAVGGGTVGFNWQRNSWVFGIEADISSGPDGANPQGTGGPFWFCGTGDCNADIEYFGTVRARAGMTAQQWLFYVTGGYAYGHVEGGIFNSAQQGSGTAHGWTVGLGTEVAFSPNWSGKAEYLHVDLGDIPFGTGIGAEPFEGDGDFDVVRIGVNYRFNLP